MAAERNVAWLVDDLIVLRQKNATHQGLSQEQLAEQADLHRTCISDEERGGENVSVNSLLRITKALGVRGRDLIADF